MKYTLIQEEISGSNNWVVRHEFTADTLDDTLRHIRYFLQGCSYVIRPEEELLIDKSVLFEEPDHPSGKKRRKK